FAYATLWKARAAYRFSREVSIYIKPDSTGQSHGKKLYAQLLEALRDTQVHLLVACITLPNPASIKLHEGLGFTRVGVFSEAGLKFGENLDVGYWQMVL
ncbi:MAG: GNAT family N-acetyltransferase, partial [Pseudomonadales bacterium]